MTAYSDYEARAIESDERARAVQGLKDEFLAAVREGDVYAIAHFAPPVKTKSTVFYQCVSGVLADSLDYSNGPQLSEVLSILCAVAYGSEPQVMAARELLDRMAGKWADFAYRGE